MQHQPNICCSTKKCKAFIFSINAGTSDIHANPVNFVFVWVPVARDKVVKVKEPLPNHLIKQQQEVDSQSKYLKNIRVNCTLRMLRKELIMVLHRRFVYESCLLCSFTGWFLTGLCLYMPMHQGWDVSKFVNIWDLQTKQDCFDSNAVTMVTTSFMTITWLSNLVD